MTATRHIPKTALLIRSARLAARLPGAWRAAARFRRRRADARGSGGGAAPRPRVLFYYSQVVWQEVWQRPQEIALGLAAYLPIIYMSPLQVHRLFDSVPDWREEFRVDRGHGVRVVQPLLLPGEYKSRLIFALNQRLVWACACAVLPPDGEILFLSNSPFSAGLLERLDWSRRVYDTIDDFPGFSWAPKWARGMEDRWLRSADAVLSGTYALSRKHKAVRPDIRFVPCGVRFEHFHDATGDAPEAMRDLPRPILGFVGTLSDRLDRQLIEALSREFSGGSIVMIGPVHGSFDAPRGLENLHLLGPRRHEDLPPYVRQFDVALMPFAINAATEAINPVKTLEYLAAGRPVVSTPIPDVVRFFSDEVVIAADRDAFVRAARELLTGDVEARRRRGIERARRESWGETVRQAAEQLGLATAQEDG